MFKRIFNIVKQFIFYPASAWRMVDNSGYESDIQRGYLLPLILTGMLTGILGRFFGHPFEVQAMIKIATVTFLSYYVGFFVAAYFIRGFILKMYDESIDWKKIFHFTAYSFTVILVVNIIIGLIPVDAFFLRIFNLYTIFIVAQGAFILNIKEEEQSRFAIVVSIIILLCPFVIRYLMNLMMPGMKV